jgi:uncharacterized RDD family membrane protein YckC
MSHGSVPPPIPPEEHEPAQFWKAEIDPEVVDESGFYRPAPTVVAPGYAPWSFRVLAFLLDTAVLVIPLVVGQVVVVLAGGDFLSGRAGGVSGVALAVYWMGALATLALALWDVVVRQGRTGQTLGKSWLRVRVVRGDDGSLLGAPMTAMRAVAHIVDAIPLFLGFLWPLWDRRGQTFADKIVGTVVINV